MVFKSVDIHCLFLLLHSANHVEVERGEGLLAVLLEGDSRNPVDERS